jgi:biotin carboxyl carrier protein
MKLIAEIDEIKHQVTIKRTEDAVFAQIDDRQYELEASAVEPDVYLFKLNNRVFQIYVAPNGLVNVGTNQVSVRLINPKQLRSLAANEGGADGIAEIKTAMPGKIIKYLVEVESEVEAGEGIVIVEAMKMQNEMKSPKDGKIKEIRFAAGDTVNAGDILAIIE